MSDLPPIVIPKPSAAPAAPPAAPVATEPTPEASKAAEATTDTGEAKLEAVYDPVDVDAYPETPWQPNGKLSVWGQQAKDAEPAEG